MTMPRRSQKALPRAENTRPTASSALFYPQRGGDQCGHLVPIVTTSMYLSSGSVGHALIYPIVVPAVMFLISVFVMPETRKHSIWEEGAIEAARARV